MSSLEVKDLAFEVPKRKLLKSISLRVERGSCVAVMGPSGSGKTSLLNCLSGISSPEAGCVVVGECDLTSLSAAKRSEFRLKYIGMVFQFGEVLPELNVLENVALPLRFIGKSKPEAETRAKMMLDNVRLSGKEKEFPASLSGGETQRVGIARALINNPELILADEPTGSLDTENTRHVLELLIRMARESGTALVLTTHDPDVAKTTDKVYRLQDGILISHAQV